MLRSSKALAFGLCLLSTSLLFGCDKSVDCSDERQGDFAISILLDSDNGECPYEGYIESTEDEERSDMSCSLDGSTCDCRAGREYGVYSVYVTDQRSGQTDVAIIEVEAAEGDVCVTRTVIERFRPEGAGGSGGSEG